MMVWASQMENEAAERTECPAPSMTGVCGDIWGRHQGLLASSDPLPQEAAGLQTWACISSSVFTKMFCGSVCHLIPISSYPYGNIGGLP